MTTFRRLLTTVQRRTGVHTGSSSFERYYGAIVRAGSGAPTADEARRDFIARDRDGLSAGWPR